MKGTAQKSNQLRPQSERALFLIQPVIFGQSRLGAPLLYFPAQIDSDERGLIIAGTHGDETASVSALSCALRSMQSGNLRHDVILSLNPDGNQLGTRANARQVDLNRAFPTRNWTEEGTVYRWSCASKERAVKVSTGQKDELEPEIEALIALINERRPSFVVSFHEPLACIDDPEMSALGHWLSERLALPMVMDVGYDTPGSFGTWCKEQDLPCITVELPPISMDQALQDYLSAIIDLYEYTA